MSRRRLDVGTCGPVFFRATASGKVEATARYRDWDGASRLVQAAAKTKRAAERILKAKRADRALSQPACVELTADSLFRELGEYWLEDLRLEGRVAQRALEDHEWVLRRVVLPVFGDLALREIGAARCDRFMRTLAKKSYSRARQARNVLRSALGLAVRHEVIHRNPVDGTARLHKPLHVPVALTPAEVDAVRFADSHAIGPPAVTQLGHRRGQEVDDGLGRCRAR